MGTNMNELKTLQEDTLKQFKIKFDYLQKRVYETSSEYYDVTCREEVANFIEAVIQKSYTLGMMKGVEMVEGELPKYPPNSDREELVLEQIKGIINKLKQELK